MKAWQIKDEVRVKKLDLLSGIENAFPIMFSASMPEKDEYTDVTFEIEDSEKEKEKRDKEEEEEEELLDEDEDEPGTLKKKKSVKGFAAAARSASGAGDEEEEEESSTKPIGFAKRTGGAGPEEVLDTSGAGWNAGGAGWGAPTATGGGPPPPPPPPGGKGPPGPPPPPGMKGAGKPLMKMRKLDWKKIPKPNLTQTVWRHLQPQGVELDVPTIIEYFKIPDDDDDKNKVSFFLSILFFFFFKPKCCQTEREKEGVEDSNC